MIERTLHEDPPAATHWTLRTRARASGLAQSTIHRIWREHGLKPHRIERALVLSVDEKSQIQALDRTQPGLPLKHGRGTTMTHDYKRIAPRRCSQPST